MSAGARQAMLLPRRCCGKPVRAIVRLGKALAAFYWVMTLGISSGWAANSTESVVGGGEAPSGRVWSLKLPEDDKLVFSGTLVEGGSVSSPAMLYPAPNVGGFIVAVITHGLIVEAQKNSQQKKAQEEADKVLEPYQSLLGTMLYPQLARPWAEQISPGDVRKLIDARESPRSDEWLIETTPVFLMAQDQRTLSLDTLVSIRAPGAAENAASQSRIRVISSAMESDDPAGAWAAESGKKLKDVSAWLFSESLNIATRMAIVGADKNDQPFRTIRYLEGRTEKMERAQQISEHCGRLLIKTLRGAFMSVPVKEAPHDNSTKMTCENAEPNGPGSV